MKKVLSLALSVGMIFSLLSTSVLATEVKANEQSEQQQIEATVESYLKKCVESIYSYKKQDVSKDTMKNVLIAARSESSTKLEQDISSFAQFQKKSGFGLMNALDIKESGVKAVLDNLDLQEDRVVYFGHLHETQKITYSHFNTDYRFHETSIEGNYAVADVSEYLDYQYSFCREPTFEITNYNISLIRVNDSWMIAEVVSDDSFFQSHYNEGFDLQTELRGYDEAFSRVEEPSLVKGSRSTLATTSSDIAYNKQNAANYALTYSTQSDDGSGTPTFKNNNFPWFGADCMNFASQCMWAGFGGSNSYADVGAKYGMDSVGSYTWWATNSNGTPSWASCGNFRSYVDGSKSSSEKGVICDTGDVAYNSNQLPFSASDLIGAVIHVKGEVNGTPYALAHAVFVNNATGSTRDTVYFTSYNNCRKNRLLSLSFPSSTTDQKNNMFVMVPRTFRSGSTGTRLWADLHNTVPMNSQEFLTGCCNVQCNTLTMDIYDPNNAAKGHYSRTNASSMIQSYSGFNMAGLWRIVLTGIDSTNTTTTFTYTVRVY